MMQRTDRSAMCMIPSIISCSMRFTMLARAPSASSDLISSSVTFDPGVSRTPDTLALAIVVAAITYLSLVVGELVPKRLALTNAEGIASRVAAPMAVLARLGAPLVWLLRSSTNAILQLLGVGDTPGSKVTEEEIKSLLAEGAHAGIVKRVEHEMIEGIMHIADRSCARS